MSAEALRRRVDAGEVEIILDLSRLLSRTLHSRPTGVDRVEMAYARQLQAVFGNSLSFAAVHPCGRYGRLNHKQVSRFLEETETAWSAGAVLPRWRRRTRALRMLLRMIPSGVPKRQGRRYYIQASPNHLDKPALVSAKLRREQAEFLCLVHDLIPIEYPEYARPGGAEQHIRRMETLATYARTLIANSVSTAESMRRFLAGQTRQPPVVALLLGTDQQPTASYEQGGIDDRFGIDVPYFLILGTIEPRKNHILLLNLWRQMLQASAAIDVPALVIVGRRGWENEHVVDMLERSATIRRHVRELSDVSDRETAALIRNARALLLPSFAEGFGMPVAEALALGTPVICSDLPALREVGGAVPDYIDPLDGEGWMAAIRDYAEADSPRRAAQIDRMNTVQLPTWKDHIDGVLGIIDDLDMAARSEG